MVKQNKIPFEFKNESENGRHVITLSGTIQKRYWSNDESIDAKLIRDALDDLTDDIVIKLNSPGGDVFQGVEMYNYLKDHPSNITVEVTGQAASAATFLIAGADKVIMNVGTSLMIHEASTFAWGNKTEIRKTLDALETIDESILSIYTNKTGQSAEQITTWINDAKRFTADEAVKYGFADEVKNDQSASNSQSDNTAAMIKEIVAKALADFQSTSNHATEPVELKRKSLLNKLKKGE